jgi:DNA-binding NarL/FixJ family response regulator
VTIRVLIADDHTLVAEGLRYIVQAELDLEFVGLARDGQEAVRMSIEHAPDVVLMDNAMPVLNGIDASRTIRQRCPNTQVIIVSMYPDQVHVLRAWQAGVRGYLLKKAIAKELVEAIRRVHAGHSVIAHELAAIGFDQLMKVPADPLQRLSFRERQVLQMVAEGQTAGEIAARLCLSPKTVETYRARLMEKLDVHDLASIVKLAIQHGIIPLEG